MKSAQEQLLEEFSQLTSWEDRYKRIIEIGRALPPLPEEYRTEDYKVKGCQSQVWLHAYIDDSGRIQFEADSDALIVKGLISILLKVYAGQTPSQVLSIKPDFLRELGFETNLSPSRANGLKSMLKQILYYAMAFQAKSAAIT